MSNTLISDPISQRGDEIYHRDIQPLLASDDHGKFVAIDIASGAFEIDSDDYTAVMRLRSRVSADKVWLVRVGQPAAYRVGQSR